MDQKFCRSCGMTLQAIAQAVSEHLGQEPVGERRSGLERWGMITGLTGLGMLALLLVATFVCLAVSKLSGMSFERFGFDFFAPLVLALALPLLFVGAGLAILPAIREKWLGPDSARRTRLQTESTKRLLPEPRGEPIVMSSVTELTTDLLEERDAEDQPMKIEEI